MSPGTSPAGTLSGSGGAVSSTRQGAFLSTYSVAAPISAGRAAPIPPQRPAPRVVLGGRSRPAPAEAPAAADLARRLGADHDRFRVQAARRLDDPGPGFAGAD